MLIPVKIFANRQQLRSAQHGELLCPVYRTNRIGLASFRSSGPSAWIFLPPRLRDLTLSIELFKTNLKTHLFKLAWHLKFFCDFYIVLLTIVCMALLRLKKVCINFYLQFILLQV